jgi:tetrahydromethanopterin S-methyltransferase subunit G
MIVLENKNQNQEWSYTGKEIAEMFLGMKQDISDLRVEMRETKMLIRDYNSLRKRLDKCEQRLDRSEGKETGEDETRRIEWDKFGYIIGLAGVLVAIIALVVK